MIQVEKKKLNSKHITIIICASVLALLIAGYAVVSALINAGVFSGSGSGGSTYTPPELVEGEALYNNFAVAYPYLPKGQIVSVAVRSHNDAFILKRPEAEEKGKYEGYFMFYYEDELGEQKVYYPNIMNEEPDTPYTDFYSVEGSDGLNAYKIDYLCASIGALYFEERIPLEKDIAAQTAQLSRYGLTAEKREVVYVSYLDEDGKLAEHRIYIGDSLITDVGFYFMLEGRDYIYTSAASERFEYLLDDFETFLHSRVVAQGLEIDSLYEPYLTTDYKQWTNTYHSLNNGGLGKLVAKDSEVVVFADLLTPKYQSDGDSNIGDGYRHDGYKNLVIDLKYISARPEFNRMINILEKTAVGEYKDNEIVATVVTNVNEATLGAEYEYFIYKIESVLTDEDEFTEVGTPVGDNDLVKVIYSATVDGKALSDENLHAVIDLSKDSVIPDDVKASLRGAKVGDELSLNFKAKYSEENSVMRDMSYVITDIEMITYIDEDGNITYPKKIEEDSIVTYSYKYLVDGYEIGKDGRATVDLSKVTEGDNLVIKNALIGKGLTAGEEIKAYSENVYCQPFADFVTYNIQTVKGFVEKEMVVSFNFVNASERDPFYGESIYENTLENENRFYALDAGSCEKAVFLLGGVGSSNSSQVSAGLVGLETVAVGLNPINMDRYGLYDGYTIYFELPRGISVVESLDNPELDDYKHLSTLGFNLYISKPNSDGTRYVGSTMYDIIVKVDGANFDYLEKSFEEFWARKNLVMIEHKEIEKVEVELGMSDVYGKYSFRLDHKTVWIKDNEHYDTPPEDGGTEYDFITVYTKALSDRLSESEFSKMLETDRDGEISLANVYDRVAGEPFAIGHDTAGTANFKEFLRLLYGVNYVGSMTEEEQAEVFATAPKIFGISFTLSNSPYGYVYDFYRASDRRVMVHIYRCDSDGKPVSGSNDEVSGFYISTFAAKKIISSVTALLNGEMINVDESYWE